MELSPSRKQLAAGPEAIFRYFHHRQLWQCNANFASGRCSKKVSANTFFNGPVLDCSFRILRMVEKRKAQDVKDL